MFVERSDFTYSLKLRAIRLSSGCESKAKGLASTCEERVGQQNEVANKHNKTTESILICFEEINEKEANDIIINVLLNWEKRVDQATDSYADTSCEK